MAGRQREGGRQVRGPDEGPQARVDQGGARQGLRRVAAAEQPLSPQLAQGGEGEQKPADGGGEVPGGEEAGPPPAERPRSRCAGQPDQRSGRVPRGEDVEAVEQPQQSGRGRHHHESGGGGVARSPNTILAALA